MPGSSRLKKSRYDFGIVNQRTVNGYHWGLANLISI